MLVLQRHQDPVGRWATCTLVASELTGQAEAPTPTGFFKGNSNTVTHLFKIEIETEAIGILDISWDTVNTPLAGLRATVWETVKTHRASDLSVTAPSCVTRSKSLYSAGSRFLHPSTRTLTVPVSHPLRSI